MADDSGRQEDATVCKFTKPKFRHNVRQRTTCEVSAFDDAHESSVVIRPEKKERRSLLYSESKKRKEEHEPVSFAYSSSGSAVPAGKADMGATSVLEIDPEPEKDPIQIPTDNIYRGQKGYAEYLEHKPQSGLSKGTGIRAGPVRAPLNIRMTCRFDFQPDICKDYKETGYCGYGDSCKFVHDRGDYKSGWQIEKEWKDREESRMKALAKGERIADDDGAERADSDSDEDNIPFACLICKERWDDDHEPVVTKCSHYFCEKCALKHYQRSTKCYVCKEQTGGMFNSAKKLLARMDRIASRALLE